VSERTERARLAAENSRLRATLAREGRLLFIAAIAVLLVGGGIGTFVFFRNLAYGDLVAARQRVDQLQTEGEKLQRQVNEQNVQMNNLSADLARTKADLDAIRPSKDRYAIPPNESRIIADGRLTIGMVGSPANESITLSINGKQQTAIAGQVITVAPDASTNCQVAVQSFDMFSALITATCTAAKPQ
jgi:hypothetical protein